MEEQNYHIAGDGISEQFFELLWSKDELNFSPSINIPDTVVYKFGQPVAWYFTATNGRLKKKSKHKLMNAQVEKEFNKYVLGYDVVATFVHKPVSGSDSSGCIMEFLDRKGLSDFFYKRQRENNGILQRFIEPKSTKNEIVRSIWSPKVCLLERAENIYNLHDHRYGLNERCVTYEGPEYYVTSAPLRGPVLAGQLQVQCEAVVSHIAEVSCGQQKVSRMVVNFKVDSRDKIWLLYTSSIRLNEEVHNPSLHRQPIRCLVNIDNVIAISETVNLNPNKSYERLPPKVRIQCISCAKESLENTRHPVTYKCIVKHYEHILHLVTTISGNNHEKVLAWPPDPEIIDAAGGVGFGCMEMVVEDDPLIRSTKLDLRKPLDLDDLRIPPILRYLHPKLSAKAFLGCKKDPLFLYKTATVCETCYLVYAEFATMLLRVGQDLTKLLTPDPAFSASVTQGGASSKNRPSAAEWSAMSSVNRSTSSAPSAMRSSNHKLAKESAIGLRSQESGMHMQPDIPSPIRQAQGTAHLVGVNSSSSFANGDQLTVMSSSTGVDTTTSASEQNQIRDMIIERERHFFKEISKNPQLRDQHPLMHLISAQQKLTMADEQSGVLGSKAANGMESVFGSRYGKQGKDSHKKYGAYRLEQPYVNNGKITLPSVEKKMRKEQAAIAKEKKRQQRILRKETMSRSYSDVNVADESDAASQMSGTTTGSLVSVNAQAARKHHGFLSGTLSKIEDEMQLSSP